MKTLILFTLIISLIQNVKGENKTLGDWATFHREADNLCKKNQHEEAVKLYREVIKGRLPYQGNQHRDVGVSWNNLGVSLYFLGENENAEKAYKKAVQILLPAGGAKHPDILTVKTNLAFIAEAKKQLQTSGKKLQGITSAKTPSRGCQSS